MNLTYVYKKGFSKSIRIWLFVFCAFERKKYWIISWNSFFGAKKKIKIKTSNAPLNGILEHLNISHLTFVQVILIKKNLLWTVCTKYATTTRVTKATLVWDKQIPARYTFAFKNSPVPMFFRPHRNLVGHIKKKGLRDLS